MLTCIRYRKATTKLQSLKGAFVRLFTVKLEVQQTTPLNTIKHQRDKQITFVYRADI